MSQFDHCCAYGIIIMGIYILIGLCFKSPEMIFAPFTFIYDCYCVFRLDSLTYRIMSLFDINPIYANNRKGHMYKRKKKLHKAIEYHKKAISYIFKEPHNEYINDSFFELGNIYYQLGNYELSVNYYEKHLNEYGHGDISFELAQAYQGKGDYEKARELYTKDLEFLKSSLAEATLDEQKDILKEIDIIEYALKKLDANSRNK